MSHSIIAEKAKLSESGASSNLTTGARTAQLGSENSWSGTLARIGSEFAGASHMLDFFCHNGQHKISIIYLLIVTSIY